MDLRAGRIMFVGEVWWSEYRMRQVKMGSMWGVVENTVQWKLPAIYAGDSSEGSS